MKVFLTATTCTAALLIHFTPAVAAVPSKQVQSSVVTALKLPLANRLQALEAQGDEAFDGLVNVAFSKQQALQVRWRSITALPHLDAKKARPYLEQALESDEWFMRNAALIAIGNMSRKTALKWSARLLQDPALVVRTAAVKNIDKFNGIELEKRLWKELHHKRNFVKGQSLWIRRHIARTLSRFASPRNEKQFVRILMDKDKTLHPWGIRGLEKIHQQRMGDNDDSVETHRSKWISWWQKNRKTSVSL